MSKEKDNYYELKGYLDRYTRGPVNDVSNYGTELEKKAEMFDEMVNIISYAATVTNCFPSVMLKDLTEDLRSIFERAKKLQEAVK